MASIEKLIELKTERLESIPDELLTRLERVQKKVLPDVLDMISLLERDKSGIILLTDKNIQLLTTAQNQLRDILLTSEYTEFTNEFIEEFETQSLLTDEYLKAAFSDFTVNTTAQKLVKLSQKSATDLFINGITDEAFADAIYKQLDLAVSNSASFADTVRNIQKLVIGDSEQDGKILQYAKQVAHDAFAISDASYTSAVAEELDVEWFLYSGHRIKNSRQFCIDRKNKYFYYKEIESWASMDWAGKIEGTNEKTIYTTRGGWGCIDVFIPVSISSVPKATIEKAINDGWFTPSDFEREELHI